MKKATRTLVDRHRPRADTWLRMFSRLVADVRQHSADLDNPGRVVPEGGLDPREPLVWATCTLLAMPGRLLQDYKELPERAADGSGIEDRLDALRADGYLFRGIDSAHQLRLAWLAALVRALDADLSQLHFGPSGDKGERWTAEVWRVPGYPCYLVPVDRSHRLADRKPAERRALAHHALLPDRVREYAVQLRLHSEAMPEEGAPPQRPFRYGAAIFPDLRISTVSEGPGFLVDAVHCPEQPTAIADQVREAREAACDVVAWPELTLAPETVLALRTKLGREALAEPHKPVALVAGSWHTRRRRGRGWANRTPVLDGRGGLLFEYDKRLKFEHEGLVEQIHPGTRLDVLVTGDRLIGIGICLDFCDDCDGDVYRSLDVDLVLVPSMGFRTTADAHARKARELQTLHASTVFAVQQVPVILGQERRADEPHGYSFVAPGPAEPPSPRQDVAFRPLLGRSDS